MDEQVIVNINKKCGVFGVFVSFDKNLNGFKM